MKILHCSDIHGDLETLCKFADFAKQRPDIRAVVCSGDLISSPFTQAESKELARITNDIINQIIIEGQPIQNIMQFDSAMDILYRAGNKESERFKELEMKFGQASKRSYQAIRSIFSGLSQRILTVPGNSDSPEYFKELEGYDIHKKIAEVDDVEFVGYGGSDVHAFSMPITKIIDYNEKEMHQFLAETVPEIVVAHMPAFSVNDCPKEGVNIGSHELAKYISNGESNLLLHGHCHEDTAIREFKGLKTIVMNPGNLGFYGSSPRKGTFLEIDYNNGQGTSAKVYQIDGSNVKQLAETPVLKAKE